MKVSELIKLLEERMNKHGDIPIKYFKYYYVGRYEFINVEDVVFDECEDCLVLNLEG